MFAFLNLVEEPLVKINKSVTAVDVKGSCRIPSKEETILPGITILTN